MRKLRLLFASAILPTSVLAQAPGARQSAPAEDSGATSKAPPATAPPATASPATDEEDSIPLRQAPAQSETNTTETLKSDTKPSPVSRSAKPTDTPEQAEPKRPSKSQTSEDDDSDDEEGDDDADDDDSEPEESPQFGYFAVGPAMLSITGYEEYGVALAGGGRFPFHDRMALNAGVTWGLTTFDRTGEWWEEARKIGSWTTRAYGDVTRWAGEGEDDDAFRYMAAFYAYIGLLFPYAVSGIMYILGPFAATSFVDFHMEATFHLFETRKGPYVGAGLGAAAIIFPIEREMKGAFGPSFNVGYDFGWFGLEARGFYSPPYLHGEPGFFRTDIFTGQFLFRFQGK